MQNNNNSVYLIGEIGVNHNGSLDIAKELIDVAADVGLDAVKFQSFDPKKTKLKQTPMAEYQKDNTEDDSSFEMSLKLSLDSKDHEVLKKYCDKKGIEFLSTGYDEDNIDLLEELNVKFHKIPSGEITNTKLIKYMASKNKPMILSTGMAELNEIDEAVQLIKKYNDNDLTIMHCVSLYPTKFEDLNLNFIKTLKKIYGNRHSIGFSDHSLGSEAGIAAVALGAEMIEKHITLDKNMEGPDHEASLDPSELKDFVDSIRKIEKSLGDSLKRVGKKEKDMRKVSRRSIVVDEDISQGDKFSDSNLSIKKPGTGISPKYLDLVINRLATRNISSDSLLEWNMVGKKAGVE